MNHISKIQSYAVDFLENNIPISHPTRFYYDKKHIFYKKQPAYDCSRAKGQLPIFSIDIKDDKASKAYVVTGYVKWWESYSTISADKRYAYEVVLPEVPCHLYVDLEVEFPNNPKIKSDINLIFVELLAELKQFMYSMYLAPKKYLDDMRFVVLDSSKSSKFSKHCIINIPGVLFEDNYQCGAFIRRFQIHILNKFGPKETNKFFVFPGNEEKRSSEHKQFLIDMGVYTKGRDFRLLGSYKRAGNAKNVPKRYLWLHKKPGLLTDKDFFDTLIQFQPKPSTIKYFIGHMIDTLNGGTPMSSSLRTVMPLGFKGQPSQSGDWDNCVENSGNSVVRFVGTSGSKRLKTNIIGCPKELAQKIGNVIYNRYKIPFTSFKRRGSSLFFNTGSHACRIKSEITKKSGSEHSKNMIYFIVFGNSGIVKQSCFNQSYCFDTSNNKHRTFNLFTIRDSDIIYGLMDWCDKNDWEWKGDSDFLVSNTWMGTDDDF